MVLNVKTFGIGFQLPKNVKYPLLALFCLSALSVLWSANVEASAFNWFWVVGQEAGLFYLMLRYGVKGHRSLFLMKVFMVGAAIVGSLWYLAVFLEQCLAGCRLDRSCGLPGIDQKGLRHLGKSQ